MTQRKAQPIAVRLEREIPAPPRDVYRAWLDPDLLRRWLAPGGITVRLAEVEAREGGHFRIWHVESGADLGGFECEIVELAPDERIVFRWGFVGPERTAGPVFDSVLTITLHAARGGSTKVTLIHERLEDLAAAMPHIADNVQVGWELVLDKLAVTLGATGRDSSASRRSATQSVIGKNNVRGIGMLRFEHVGVVVDDLDAVSAFFLGLGFEREGGALVEGEVVDKINGLDGVRAEVVMVRTPDGSGRLELVKYHAPADDQGAHPLPANRLGFRHIAIQVNDLNTIVDGLRDKGFDTVGEVQDYEGGPGGFTYRLCYVRGPEGLIVELAEQIASEGAS